MNSVCIEIDGMEYHLRPNFKAASMIESSLGKALPQVPHDVASMNLTAIHAVLVAAFHGNGYEFDSRKLGDLVVESFGTHDMPLIQSAIQYISAFFPKVDNDGVKKRKATTKQAG